MSILSADDLHVPVVATVTLRAKPDAIYSLHLSIGPSYYEDVVQPAFMTQSISSKLVKQQAAKQRFFEVEIAKRDADIERARARGLGDAIRI